jgi:hypothetical protein
MFHENKKYTLQAGLDARKAEGAEEFELMKMSLAWR